MAVGRSNEEVTTWMRRRRLDEGAFLLRHLEISKALDEVDTTPAVDQISARGSV